MSDRGESPVSRRNGRDYDNDDEDRQDHDEARGSAHSDQLHNIFIGNCDSDVPTIREFFESYGLKVVSVDIKKKYAFVECSFVENIEDILDRMRGRPFKNSDRIPRIELKKHVDNRRREEERRREQPPTSSLFVIGHDPVKTSAGDLLRLFSTVAVPRDARRVKNFCFVDFNSVEEATRVLEHFQDKELDGRMLSIEYRSDARMKSDDRDRGSRHGRSRDADYDDWDYSRGKRPREDSTDRYAYSDRNPGRDRDRYPDRFVRDAAESRDWERYPRSDAYGSDGYDQGTERRGDYSYGDRGRSPPRASDSSYAQGRGYDDYSTTKALLTSLPLALGLGPGRLYYEFPDGRMEPIDLILERRRGTAAPGSAGGSGSGHGSYSDSGGASRGYTRDDDYYSRAAGVSSSSSNSNSNSANASRNVPMRPRSQERGRGDTARDDRDRDRGRDRY